MRAAVPRVLPGPAAIRTRVGGLSARTKRRLLALLAALLLLVTVHYAWFRDSSFVAVEDVRVVGVVTDDGPRIRARLVHAAQQQTTLHVDEEALMRALPAGSAVAELRVTTDFPHGMRIEVIQHPPVAVLVAPGRRVAVASDGSLLEGVKGANVPSIVVGDLPGSGRLGRGRALRIVGAAAAAPPALRARVERVRELPGKGLVAYLERGPQVILGDASSLRAKWAAAAAILADGSSRGASYVDVRLPDRPVAGGVSVPQPEAEQPAAPSGQTPGAAVDPATGAPPAGTAPQPGATAPPAQQAAPPTTTQPPTPGATPATP